MVIFLTSSLDGAHLVATDDLVMHDWILDSGVSFHVTPHNKKLFTTYDDAMTRSLELVMCSSSFNNLYTKECETCVKAH